jgi:hypothetical protein
VFLPDGDKKSATLARSHLHGFIFLQEQERSLHHGDDGWTRWPAEVTRVVSRRSGSHSDDVFREKKCRIPVRAAI